MKRLLLALCIAVFSIGATGCAALGGVEQSQPMTFDKRLKFAQDQATNILKACTALVAAGRMDAAEAKQCMDFVEEAKAAIDVARTMKGADQMAQLMAIQEALLRVEAFLQARQA